MDRREMLWNFSASFLEERIACRSDEIRGFFAEHGRYRQSFMSAMETFFERVAEQQACGTKNKICYIAFYFLRSSVLLDKAELMIAAYDEELYLNETETHVFWSLDILAQYAAEDMAALTPKLYAKIPRLREYEVEELGQMLLANYILLCIPFVTEALPQVFQSASFLEIKGASEISVIGGEFMGQCADIYKHMGMVSK